MSYLSLPRLVFYGQFQADVSTVNNDVRHFDNATFEPRFQAYQTRVSVYSESEILWNGWFSPNGSGAFRLIDVRITDALTEPRAWHNDEAIGLFLNSQSGRAAAKIVDIDPQWQLASGIWGLEVVLTDGTTEYMRGTYFPGAFRELNFARAPGNSGDSFATAKFTSTLTDVRWTEAAENSASLSALKAAAEANGDRLSMNMTTFGYNGGASTDDFTLGRVCGTISTWQEGDPMTFVPGRRFAPVPSAFGSAQNQVGLGFFDGVVENGRVSIDLSAALPLAGAQGPLADIGPIELVILKTGDTISDDATPVINPAVKEGASVTPADYVALGGVPYRRPGWLEVAAGIVDAEIGPDAACLIDDHPLALIGPGPDSGSNRVLVRETYGGYFVRADDFVKRIDAIATGLVTSNTDVYATQWGKRLPNAVLNMELLRPEAGQGGTGEKNEFNKPAAKIHSIGKPQNALKFEAHPTCGPRGVLAFRIDASNPGNPRKYIDGQIFLVRTEINAKGVSAQPPFEPMVLHVREAFEPPEKPDWAKIKPIMEQYSNLYPVMSRGLFSLTDPDTLKKHADILYFAFSRSLDDPNYMPVTRDLSTGKRQMILNWLKPHLTKTAPPVMAAASALPPAEAAGQSGTTPTAAPLAPAAAELLENLDRLAGEPVISKIHAIRNALRRGST